MEIQIIWLRMLEKIKKEIRSIDCSMKLFDWTNNSRTNKIHRKVNGRSNNRTKLIISRRSIQSSQNSSSSTFVAQCHPFYLSLVRSVALVFRHIPHIQFVWRQAGVMQTSIGTVFFVSSVHFPCSAPVSLFLFILHNVWLLVFIIFAAIYWLISWFVPFTIVEMLLFCTLFPTSHQSLHVWLLKCEYQLHTKPSW